MNTSIFATDPRITGESAKQIAGMIAGACVPDDLVTCLAALGIEYHSAYQNHGSDAGPALQRRLLADLCKEGAPWLLSDFESGRLDQLVHQEQLLLGIKLAILFGDPSSTAPPPDLGQFLLALNGILESQKGTVTTGYKHAGERMRVALEIQQLALRRNEQARYVLGRYYDLLVTRSKDFENHKGWVDVSGIFEKQTGLRVDTFIAYGMACYGEFSKARDWPEVLTASRRISGYEHQLDPLIASNLRHAYARDAGAFGSKLGTQETAFAFNGYLPFQRTPLYQRSDNLLVPVSMELLLDKATTGLYWEAVNFVIDNPGETSVQALVEYVGRPFQAYATELLRIAHSGEEARGSRFWSEDELAHASGHRNGIPDGALVENDRLILFECTASAPTVASLISPASTKLATQMEEKFVGKIRQLRDGIKRVQTGGVRIPGTNPDHLRRVFPVLVLLHPLPTSVLTLSNFAEVVRDISKLATDGGLSVAPVQMVTAEDLEILEPLIADGWSLSTLLHEKTATNEGRDADMKTYLFGHPDFVEKPNERVIGLTKDATDKVMETLSSAA